MLTAPWEVDAPQQTPHRKACRTRLRHLAKAIRGLWGYVFQTPILGFDDYWEEDSTEDTVRLKTTEFRVGISGSEEIFLGIWLNHYNQSGSSYLKDFSLPRLDETNQSKLLWLLNVLKEFRVY